MCVPAIPDLGLSSQVLLDFEDYGQLGYYHPNLDNLLVIQSLAEFCAISLIKFWMETQSLSLCSDCYFSNFLFITILYHSFSMSILYILL